jgi:PHD/YefM family antitoxin component YafN of YafNO toxin-antitoxin module
MTKRLTMDQLRDDIEAISEAIRASGDPVIVERAGEAVVALVSLEDFDALDRLRRAERLDHFSRRAAAAARSAEDTELSEDEIVRRLKETRAALFRERYGST